MTFRKFDTGTWTDPWFENLSHKAKLAFIYFWTNETCNPAGIYDISSKRIEFELGYSIDTVSEEISPKVFWNCEKNYIWVINFFKRQCQNYKFAIAALNSIKDDRHKLSVFISHNKRLLESFTDKEGNQIISLCGYSIDTVSIPYLIEKRREEADKSRAV